MLVALASVEGTLLVVAAVAWGGVAPEARRYELFLVALACSMGACLIGAARGAARDASDGSAALLLGVGAGGIAVVSGLGALLAAAANMPAAAVSSAGCLLGAAALLWGSGRSGATFDAWVAGPAPVVAFALGSLAVGLTALFLVGFAAAGAALGGRSALEGDALAVLGAVAAIAAAWAGVTLRPRRASIRVAGRASIAAGLVAVAVLGTVGTSTVASRDLSAAQRRVQVAEAACDPAGGAAALPAPRLGRLRAPSLEEDAAARARAACLAAARGIRPWSAGTMALFALTLVAVALAAAVTMPQDLHERGSSGSSVPAET